MLMSLSMAMALVSNDVPRASQILPAPTQKLKAHLMISKSSLEEPQDIATPNNVCDLNDVEIPAFVEYLDAWTTHVEFTPCLTTLTSGAGAEHEKSILQATLNISYYKFQGQVRANYGLSLYIWTSDKKKPLRSPVTVNATTRGTDPYMTLLGTSYSQKPNGDWLTVTGEIVPVE
jgi:hypothetical protein